MLLHVVVPLMPDTKRASPRIQIGISMSVTGTSVSPAAVVAVGWLGWRPLGSSSGRSSYASVSVSTVPLPSDSGEVDSARSIGLAPSRLTVPRPVPHVRRWVVPTDGRPTAPSQPDHPAGKDCSSVKSPDDVTRWSVGPTTIPPRKLPPRDVEGRTVVMVWGVRWLLIRFGAEMLYNERVYRWEVFSIPGGKLYDLAC
uniref:Uncharacterized protein n=1 Tax=Anopheles farauti TaxID=69004 RepID=A0A182QSV6_9DIPT